MSHLFSADFWGVSLIFYDNTIRCLTLYKDGKIEEGTII